MCVRVRVRVCVCVFSKKQASKQTNTLEFFLKNHAIFAHEQITLAPLKY